MIPQFQKLSDEERALLYKAPVLVSVLASCSYNQVNMTQKEDAIKLAHIRRFTADPVLHDYYKEVEKGFKEHFEEAANIYAPFDEVKRNEIKKEIDQVNVIIGKLDSKYGEILHNSLESYARHVKNSVHTVFQDFIFPIAYSRMNH